MTAGNQEDTVLPYELRVEIWDLITKPARQKKS